MLHTYKHFCCSCVLLRWNSMLANQYYFRWISMNVTNPSCAAFVSSIAAQSLPSNCFFTTLSVFSLKLISLYYQEFVSCWWGKKKINPLQQEKKHLLTSDTLPYRSTLWLNRLFLDIVTWPSFWKKNKIVSALICWILKFAVYHTCKKHL